MIARLRVLSLLCGTALVVGPSYLLLVFAYGVGQSAAFDESPRFILTPLCRGLVVGGGLLLVGIRRLIPGVPTPIGQLVDGSLIALCATFLYVIGGFPDSVTKVANAVILLLERVVFLGFVWPSKSFKEIPPRRFRGFA